MRNSSKDLFGPPLHNVYRMFGSLLRSDGRSSGAGVPGYMYVLHCICEACLMVPYTFHRKLFYCPPILACACLRVRRVLCNTPTPRTSTPHVMSHPTPSARPPAPQTSRAHMSVRFALNTPKHMHIYQHRARAHGM